MRNRQEMQTTLFAALGALRRAAPTTTMGDLMRTFSFSTSTTIRARWIAGAVTLSLVATFARPAQAATCIRSANGYQAMVDDFKASISELPNDIRSEQGRKGLFVYLQTCGNSWLSQLPETTNLFPQTAGVGETKNLACGLQPSDTVTAVKLQQFEKRGTTHQIVDGQGATISLTNARTIPTLPVNLHVPTHFFHVPKTAFGNQLPVLLTEYFAAAEEGRRTPPVTTNGHLDIYIAPEEGLAQTTKDQINGDKEICPIRMLNKVNYSQLFGTAGVGRQYFSASRSVFMDPTTAGQGSLWSWKTSQTFNFGEAIDDRGLDIKQMERTELRKTIAVSAYVKALQLSIRDDFKDLFPNMIYDEYAYLLEERQVGQDNTGAHLCSRFNTCGKFENRETHGTVYREYKFHDRSWLVPGFAVNTFWMDVVPQLAIQPQERPGPITEQQRLVFLRKYVEDAAETFAKMHLITGLTLVAGYHGQNAVWELTAKNGAVAPLDVASFDTKVYLLDFGDGGIITGTRQSLVASDFIGEQIGNVEWEKFTTGTNSRPSGRAFVPEDLWTTWPESVGIDVKSEDVVGIGYRKTEADGHYKAAYKTAWRTSVQRVLPNEVIGDDVTLEQFINSARGHAFYTALYNNPNNSVVRAERRN